MKIPPTENVALTKNERIIRRGIDFDFDHPLPVRVSVSGSSVHLRYAPNRIRILHLRAVEMRRQDFRSNYNLPHNLSRPGLARMRPRFMDSYVKWGSASANRLQRHCGSKVRRC